jgi:hypothetical protein
MGILPEPISIGISWRNHELSSNAQMSAIITSSINSSAARTSILRVRSTNIPLTREILLLQDDLDAYRYLKGSRKSVQGMDDVAEFATLKVLHSQHR